MFKLGGGKVTPLVPQFPLAEPALTINSLTFTNTTYR